MKKQKVLIIGAGAAGLIAANDLGDTCDVVVLEAQGSAGGRIRSIHSPSTGCIVEGGAEFVHGNLPITRQLADEAGLTLLKMDGKMMRKDNGGWTEQKDMVEGWDALMKKMKETPGDDTMKDFLEKHFAGNRFKDLREKVSDFVNGFDLAPPDLVSVKSLYEEWSSEDDQYRIKQGYSGLVSFLYSRAVAKRCTFLFEKRVEEIRWSAGIVEVVTNDGIKMAGDKAIITLPAGPMSQNAIRFVPHIDEHLAAYRRIGYGPVIKMVFEFKSVFWDPEVAFYFSDETIPTWWTQYPLATPHLTGWAGGDAASKLKGMDQIDIRRAGLQSLSSLFGKSPEELSNILANVYVFNWMSYDLFRGAYSFSTPETREARKVLSNPIAGTLFFAGEGLTGGAHPGTVEAALKSGRIAAGTILKTLV